MHVDWSWTCLSIMESSPKIRDVEAFPLQSDGEEVICVRDPEGFAEGPIILNKYLAFLIARMNGQNWLREGTRPISGGVSAIPPAPPKARWQAWSRKTASIWNL